MFNNDIYNYTDRYERTSILIDKSDLSDKNKELISGFTRAKKRSVGYPTVIRYALAIYQSAKWFNKDMDKVELNDIDKFIEKLENGKITKNDGTNYSHASIRNFKLGLKVFFHYLGKDDISKEIKATKENKEISINDLWSEGEIYKLISAIKSIQNKAIASCTIEGALRIGETASMTIGSVIFDREDLQNGECLIQVDGKTGPRTIMLVWSNDALRKWLEIHPHKDNKNYPLWINKKEKPKKYSAFSDVFKTAKIMTGIQKPANPHNFRKSMTTILRRKGYDIELIKKRNGWTRNSTVMDRYEAIDTKAVFNEERRINGLSTGNKKIMPNAKPCPFCYTINQLVAT
ncbi:MAG: site-specific integrase, partial [Nanoarchaeota archaeon]|nr:site-specific integrase [Nanoarchaeota archaeon]